MLSSFFFSYLRSSVDLYNVDMGSSMCSLDRKLVTEVPLARESTFGKVHRDHGLFYGVQIAFFVQQVQQGIFFLRLYKV